MFYSEKDAIMNKFEQNYEEYKVNVENVIGEGSHTSCDQVLS